MDRHGYFSGKHEGEGASYSVRVGHSFQSLAAVTVPEQVPLQFMQIADYPHIISEIGWPNPNRYRADATFLASAYGALQGVDGFYFFAVGSNYLCDGSLAKFAVSCPLMAGTFPAAALQYRKGMVREAEEVVHQVVNLEDLYALKGSAVAAAQALDELRKQDLPAGVQPARPANLLDPLAFYVGRVVRSFGADPGKSLYRDLSPYVDRAQKKIKSLTGELLWDYGLGVVTVNTAQSQGAAGFLGRAGPIRLRNVTIDCRNEFAAVLVVSLDDRPLATSRKILIQAATEEQPYGFKTDGGRIVDLGGPPLEVKKVTARVALRWEGGGRPTVTALDENGYATDKKVTVTGDGVHLPLSIELAEDALYHVVRGF
jgi:hypothetical protein